MKSAPFALISSLLAITLAGCTDVDTSTSENALGHQTSCPASKVLVCHLPPGNPANMQEICISPAAVDTHVRLHGDSVGACAPTCTEEDFQCGDGRPECCEGLTCNPNNGLCEASET
jgi:hypothetical protein